MRPLLIKKFDRQDSIIVENVSRLIPLSEPGFIGRKDGRDVGGGGA